MIKDEESERSLQPGNPWLEFEFDPQRLGDPASDGSLWEQEWDKVFRHFNPRLKAHFSSMIQDSLELDDLLSQIWRVALRKLWGVRSHRAAWSYLVRIGHNRLKDQWKTDARRRKTLDAYAVIALIEEDNWNRTLKSDEPPSSGWPADPDVIARRVAELPEAERRLIELRHAQGLTHEEAAAQLGITADAARKRYSRILKLLRASPG